MCDNCSCPNFVAHAWRTGRCRDCMHPFSAHKDVQLLVSSSIDTSSVSSISPSSTPLSSTPLEFSPMLAPPSASDSSQSSTVTFSEPVAITKTETAFKRIGRLSIDRLAPFSLSSPDIRSLLDGGNTTPRYLTRSESSSSLRSSTSSTPNRSLSSSTSSSPAFATPNTASPSTPAPVFDDNRSSQSNPNRNRRLPALPDRSHATSTSSPSLPILPQYKRSPSFTKLLATSGHSASTSSSTPTDSQSPPLPSIKKRVSINEQGQIVEEPADDSVRELDVTAPVEDTVPVFPNAAPMAETTAPRPRPPVPTRTVSLNITPAPFSMRIPEPAPPPALPDQVLDDDDGEQPTSSELEALPSPMDMQAMPQRVLDELLQTEKDYCSDLDYLNDEAVIPLSKLLTKVELNSVFSSIQVIRNVNHILLQELTQNPSNVGHIFIKYSAYFKCYAQYCTDHPSAVTALQQVRTGNHEVEKILKRIKDYSRAGCLGVEDFLIKPVQRICKYPLLLQELIKYTPEDHPDMKALKDGLTNMLGVAQHVNEFSREVEAMNRVIAIQSIVPDLPFSLVTSSRRLIHEGQILLRYTDYAPDRPWSNRRAWLFNDILILGRVPNNPFSRKFHYTAHYPIKSLEVNAGGVSGVANKDSTLGALPPVPKKTDKVEKDREDVTQVIVFNLVFYLTEHKGDSANELAVILCKSKPERDAWVQHLKQHQRRTSVVKEAAGDSRRASTYKRYGSTAHDEMIRSLTDIIAKNAAKTNESHNNVRVSVMSPMMKSDITSIAASAAEEPSSAEKAPRAQTVTSAESSQFRTLLRRTQHFYHTYGNSTSDAPSNVDVHVEPNSPTRPRSKSDSSSMQQVAAESKEEESLSMRSRMKNKIRSRV